MLFIDIYKSKQREISSNPIDNSNQGMYWLFQIEYLS